MHPMSTCPWLPSSPGLMLWSRKIYGTLAKLDSVFLPVLSRHQLIITGMMWHCTDLWRGSKRLLMRRENMPRNLLNTRFISIFSTALHLFIILAIFSHTLCPWCCELTNWWTMDHRQWYWITVWHCRWPAVDESSCVRSHNQPLTTGEQLWKQSRFSWHLWVEKYSPLADCRPRWNWNRQWMLHCLTSTKWQEDMATPTLLTFLRRTFLESRQAKCLDGGHLLLRWRASKRLGIWWRRWRGVGMGLGCMSLTRSCKPRIELLQQPS